MLGSVGVARSVGDASVACSLLGALHPATAVVPATPSALRTRRRVERGMDAIVVASGICELPVQTQIQRSGFSVAEDRQNAFGD
jgi:hypothetical protein